MVFSREVIRRVGPHLRNCVRHLYSWHEDVELSRCIRRFAEVNCAWSYQVSCGEKLAHYVISDDSQSHWIGIHAWVPFASETDHMTPQLANCNDVISRNIEFYHIMNLL